MQINVRRVCMSMVKLAIKKENNREIRLPNRKEQSENKHSAIARSSVLKEHSKERIYIFHMQTENNQMLELQWMPVFERIERVFNSFSCFSIGFGFGHGLYGIYGISVPHCTSNLLHDEQWAFSFLKFIYLLFVPRVWSLFNAYCHWLPKNRTRAHTHRKKNMGRQKIGGNNLFGDVFVCFGLSEWIYVNNVESLKTESFSINFVLLPTISFFLWISPFFARRRLKLNDCCDFFFPTDSVPSFNSTAVRKRVIEYLASVLVNWMLNVYNVYRPCCDSNIPIIQFITTWEMKPLKSFSSTSMAILCELCCVLCSVCWWPLSTWLR